VTGAELDRLMRERPRPGHPSDYDDGEAGPPGVTIAARLGDTEIAALARLRLELGQHDASDAEVPDARVLSAAGIATSWCSARL
jgi:hypothetical protein